jgi:hypothetical protein
MAVTIPNLDKIQKGDPKLGEAIARIRQYVNLNVTPEPGNRTPAPPIDPTQIRG